MKKHWITTIFTLLATLMMACSDSEESLQPAGLNQGVKGKVMFREGNCMPAIDGSSCKETYVSRRVMIYELTPESMAVPAPANSAFYTAVNSQLIASVSSDQFGRFQASLDEGTYSIFVIEDGLHYSNGWTSEGIQPFTVDAGQVTDFNFLIDYKAVY